MILDSMIEVPSQTPVSSWLPWSWCNLRRNPFGELTHSERAELAVVDVDAIIKRAAEPFRAVQLIGDCGRGKTTRMLVLRKCLPDASYVYLAEHEPCVAIPYGNPLLIDEAQRLPHRVLKLIAAEGLPMVLATHRDQSRVLRRAGYQVDTLPIGQTNDIATIHRIVNRRIEAARLNQGAVPTFTFHHAQQLSDRFGTDIRAMESYLYEIVQQQRYGNGEMRFVD